MLFRRQYFFILVVLFLKDSICNAQTDIFQSDSIWYKYINDGRIGPRRTGVTTNLLEPYYGMVSIGVQYLISHRSGIEIGFGKGFWESYLDIKNPRKYSPYHENEYNNLIHISKIYPKNMQYVRLCYILGSTGLNQCTTAGIELRKRNGHLTFDQALDNNTNYKATTIGLFFSSQTTIYRSITLGYSLLVGSDKVNLYNYPYRIKQTSSKVETADGYKTSRRVLMQLKLIYII